MSDERRRHPRFKLTVPVRLTVAGEELPCLLRDICRDAALVESPRALEIDTTVLLGSELPDTGGPFEVVGRVIRVAETEGEIHPLAVLFTDASPSAATRIDLFLARQEQEQ
jgi:hypothetical protein